MEAMKYLIEVDGILAGYNNPKLLLIDLYTNKPAVFKLWRLIPGMAVQYEFISADEIKQVAA